MALLFNVLLAAEDPAAHAQAMTSGLDLLHVVADGIVAVSLFVIPAILVFLYLSRGDRSGNDRTLLMLFILFLGTAGLVHFASALFGPAHGASIISETHHPRAEG